MEIGQGSEQQDVPYSIGEILRYKKAPEVSQYSFVEVSSAKILSAVIFVIGRIVEKYCQELLRGEQTVFDDLRRQREYEMVVYAQERELRRLKKLGRKFNVDLYIYCQ